MSEHNSKVDVLIIGSGIMGAIVARLVRHTVPTATIAMVDGGPVIGASPGMHLHGTSDRERWLHYNRWRREPRPINNVAKTAIELQPGLHELSAFGQDATEMPGALLSWNSGGMGTHWSAVTPAPWGTEIPDCVPAEQWQSDLAVAESVLRVRADPFGDAGTAGILRACLNDIFGDVSVPGREIRPMPMALVPTRSGHFRRVGPNLIFPAMSDGSDARFMLFPSNQAFSLSHDGETVGGAKFREMETGAEWWLEASATVLCADAFRTPQLLYASEIRPPALGRFLNEHAFLDGRVLADLKSLGISSGELPDIRPGEWRLSAQWLPHSGSAQPFHGQFSDIKLSDAEGNFLGYSISLNFFVPAEISEENRLEFSDSETDVIGMPRITIRFARSRHDTDLIEASRAVQRRTAERFGDFDPAAESWLRPTGSSLHTTGTVRMGAAEDGSSVCDPETRVWGYRNLFVAGCGVVPTAMACNTTLSAAVTAVRAARGVATLLQDRAPQR